MKYHASRVLRTASSERHILKLEAREIGAVDLHYLADGRVAATVILLEEGGSAESDVSEILKYIDDELLPEVSVEEDNLVFTIVRGRLLGSYTRVSDASTGGH
jgi:hypothetical protein